MAGRTVRRIGRGLAIVETQFKARRTNIGGSGERKSAKRDEEALCRDGIGDDQTQKRSSEPPGQRAEFDHFATNDW